MNGLLRVGGLGTLWRRTPVLFAAASFPGGAGLVFAADVCSLALGARSAGHSRVAV